jgi:integrase
MRLPIHKEKDTGIWWFRKRIPTDLIAEFKEHTGKKIPEFKVSLGVRDESDAKQLGLAQLEKYNDLVRYLRSRAQLSPEGIRRARLSLFAGGLTRTIRKEIDLELIQSLKQKAENELDEAIRKKKTLGSDEIVRPAFRRREMRVSDYIKYLQNAVRILHIHERMFLEPGYNPIKELEATSDYLEDNELNIRDYILRAVKEGRLDDKGNLVSPAVIHSNTPTIEEAIDIWIETKSPRPRSVTEWRYAVKRFTELHTNMPVGAIEDEHIVSFRQALIKIPSRLPVHLRDKPLPELVALADSGKLKGKGKERSRASINKLLVALSSLLQTMMDEGKINRNVAKRKLLRKDTDGTERPPYDPVALRQLFNSEVYQSNYWRSPAKEKNRPSRFWIPLIAVFTGLRIEEISALRISDIREEGGVPYFSINKEDKRKFKSKAAYRMVVIHDELINAGLLRYVEEQKKRGDGLLFYDRTQTADGRVSSSLSNWYGRYTKRIGIKHNDTTFHSLRDNFNDACENADFTDRQVRRIMGHKISGAGKHYGNGLWLKKTAELMKRLQYPDLNLSHLYIKDRAAPAPKAITPAHDAPVKKKRLKLKQRVSVLA